MGEKKDTVERVEYLTLGSEEAISPATIKLNSFKRRSNPSLSIISSTGRPGDSSPLKLEQFTSKYDERKLTGL